MRRVSRRHRLQLAALTVFCLLFQHMAVAAYACTMAMPVAAATGCHADPDGAPGPDPVCAKHCAPDTATAAESRSGSVPALALPPALHPLRVSLPPACSGIAAVAVTPHAAAPPPGLQYARLLI